MNSPGLAGPSGGGRPPTSPMRRPLSEIIRNFVWALLCSAIVLSEVRRRVVIGPQKPTSSMGQRSPTCTLGVAASSHRAGVNSGATLRARRAANAPRPTRSAPPAIRVHRDVAARTSTVRRTMLSSESVHHHTLDFISVCLDAQRVVGADLMEGDSGRTIKLTSRDPIPIEHQDRTRDRTIFLLEQLQAHLPIARRDEASEHGSAPRPMFGRVQRLMARAILGPC